VSVEVGARVIEDRSEGDGALTAAVRAGSRKWRSRVYAVAPGESFRCSVLFTPKTDLKVNRIVAILQGEEKCRSGSGTNSRTHTHVVCRQELVLAEAASYMARMPVEVSGTVTVPETSAYSFQAKENKLIWKLAVSVDLPKWADWTRDTKLCLVPAADSR
jgi:hypothetical protein